MSPADIRTMLGYTPHQRASGDPFDVVAIGWAYEHGKEARLADYVDAGVTWGWRASPQKIAPLMCVPVFEPWPPNV